MGHDEKFWRLAELFERDIALMLDAQAKRVAGFEDVAFDPNRGVIAYFAEGKRLWTAHVEVIGWHTRDIDRFRWWWSGQEPRGTKLRLDTAFAEGNRLAIPSLTTGQVPVASEEEAIRLAHVAAVLAHASGVYRTRDPQRLAFYALFDSAESGTVDRGRSSLPPPSRSQTGAPPAATKPSWPPAAPSAFDSGYPAPLTESAGESAGEPARSAIMSMLPPVGHPTLFEPGLPQPRDRWIDPQQAAAPVAALPVRDPTRAVVMPVANLVLTAVTEAITDGFNQAMLVVDVSITEARARFSGVIVATNAAGELIAVPTPQSLMGAVGQMILEDTKSGNGRWRRVVIRLRRSDQRVMLQTEVVP